MLKYYVFVVYYMFEELNKILDAIDKHLPALPTPTDFDFKEFEREWTGTTIEDQDDLR